MPDVFRTEGTCCHSVMHFSTCLYHLWEPFAMLLFIASELCYIWLRNEVFVKWSVLWSKVPLHFHMIYCGLVTVAWYSCKICWFCTVGIEAVLYDHYESAFMMSLLCWLKKYLMFFSMFPLSLGAKKIHCGLDPVNRHSVPTQLFV